MECEGMEKKKHFKETTGCVDLWVILFSKDSLEVCLSPHDCLVLF